MLSWRRAWPWLLLVVAAVGWGVLWAQLDRSVLTRVPVMDEAYYLREGAAIAAGHLLPDQPFVMSPLYPYLLAASGSGREVALGVPRSGPPPYGIRILQAVAWGLVVFLLWRAGRHLLPTRLAWLPAALFVLYRPAAIFVTTTLLEMLLTCTVTLFLYLITFREEGRHPLGEAVLAGVLVGLATLLRGHALLLLLPGAVALGLRPGGRRRIAGMVVAAVLVLAPVVLVNSLLAGRLVGTSCNGGLNLYIGNGPEADGFYVTFAGAQPEADPAGVVFLAERLGRPVAGEVEADRIWARAAWDAIRRNPGRALSLWLRKVWLHGVDWEISQVTPLPAWSRDAPLLRLLVVPYGLLAAAGLTGLLLTCCRDRRVRIWALALVVLVASQSVFFVVTRYRQVLVPLLCLLAAAGLGAVLRASWKQRVMAAVLLAAGLVAFRPWGLASLQTRWTSLGDCNEGIRWEWLGDAGSLIRAEALYRDALVVDPALWVAYRGLARVLVREERREEAEQVLSEGVLKAERGAGVEKDLIFLLLEEGRLTEALPRLDAYVRNHPPDADVLHDYSVALARTGRLDAALAAARRLAEAFPDDARGYIDQGVLLVRAGRREEALAIFRGGLVHCPDDPALLRNLELLEGSP
jgi:thioredoxin-like negative regulator of GroEL